MGAVGVDFGIDGHRCANGAKRARKVGVILIGDQLGAHALLDKWVVDGGVDSVEGSKLRYQCNSRLLADTCDTGDVIGGVAHKRLYINKVSRGQSVIFLGNRGRIISNYLGVAHFGRGKQHLDPVTDKLEGVAVTRGNIAGVPLLLCGKGKGAEYIIRLIARKLDGGKTHQVQYLLKLGHLLGKLGRHTLASCLVSVIHLMTEGRRVQVKCDRNRVRLGHILEPKKNIQKSNYSVSELSILCGQQFDAVKRAIDDAVSVNQKKLHSAHLSLFL